MNEWSGSYNARSISSEQIARLFVTPSGFDEILKFQNSVLVGPRGTGKTTILKLITPSGLHHWFKRPDVEKVQIDYIPIYIPSDTTWKGEASIAADRHGSTEIANLIQNGIFVNYCLYQTVAAMEDARNVGHLYRDEERPAWCLKISRQQEGDIAEHLSGFWSLREKEYSFLGLKLSLLKRINSFSAFVNSLDVPPIDNLHALPALDLLPMIRGFLDVVEATTGHRKWSLNFDEMEIAPARVLRLLYESLRSFDQRVVFKFSLFPFVDFLRPDVIYRDDFDGHHLRNAPVEGQDYEAVRLSGKFRAERSSFAETIVAGICERAGINFDDFVSFVDRSDEVSRNRERRGSLSVRNYKRQFHSLYIKDASFRKYIESNDINIDEIDKYAENRMAPLIRKVAPLVEFRDRHLRDRPKSHSSIARRARKGYGYYHGFQQMVRISESNPRALNFYVNDLIAAFREHRDSQTAQNIVIPKNVDRFRAMVATQVIPPQLLKYQDQNALAIVDALGRNLARIVLGWRFLTEPPLSYQLGNLDTATLGIIGIAVNTGALIVDSGPNDQALITDLRGVRVRVSHQLSPYYPLPTVTGQYITIHKLPSTKEEDDQADLLGWEGNDT